VEGLVLNQHKIKTPRERTKLLILETSGKPRVLIRVQRKHVWGEGQEGWMRRGGERESEMEGGEREEILYGFVWTESLPHLQTKGEIQTAQAAVVLFLVVVN